MKNKMSQSVSLKTSTISKRSAEKEAELLLRAQQGDVKARDRFLVIKENLLLKVVRSFFFKEFFFNDMCQEGRLALLDAIKSFDLNHGEKFDTYASQVIKNRLFDFFYDNDSLIKVSRQMRQKLKDEKKALERLSKELNVDVPLCCHEEKSQTKLKNLRLAAGILEDIISIDSKCDDESGNDDNVLNPLLNTLTSVHDNADYALNQFETSRLYDWVKLSENERQFVKMLMEEEDKKTAVKCYAEKFGVTPTRARQICNAAIDKLRPSLGFAA